MKRALSLPFVLALACLLFCAGIAQAQTYAMSGATVPGFPVGGPGFVIASDQDFDNPDFSDPNFNRWFIRTQATGTIDNSGGATTVLVTLRWGFRLVDSSGGVLSLVGADANGWIYTANSSFAVNAGNVFNPVRSANLVPTPGTRIDPSLRYRVEARLQRDTGAGYVQVATNNSAYTFWWVHFVGPAATDAARNAVAYLPGTGTYTQTFAVNTDNANRNFRLNVPYRLYRYDEPQSSTTASADIDVFFAVELFDAAVPGVPIALAPLANSTTVSIPAKGLPALPQPPALVTGSVNVAFRPADGVQLDSPGTTYIARVTISHVERIFPPQTLTGNSDQFSSQRLLHFNGRLIFGAGTANPINTTLTSVNTNPASGAVVLPAIPPRVETTLGTAAGGGVVDGTSHTFTAAPAQPIVLISNGDAQIRGAGAVTVIPPSTPDRDELAGVRFDRGTITLNTSGASTASISVILPAGMGHGLNATQKRLQSRLPFSATTLNQGLDPISDLVWAPQPGFEGWVTEETKPVLVRVVSVTWARLTGRFNLAPHATNIATHARAAEYTQLEASPVSASQIFKRSNEQYWRWVTLVAAGPFIQTGTAGGAEFTGFFAVNNGTTAQFRPHFPWGASMRLLGGVVSVSADLITPGASSYLDLQAGSPNITMTWGNGCTEPNCDPGNPANTTQTFTPDAGRLRLTPDGGLVAAGVFPAGLDLRWGFIPSLTVYAHRVTTSFADGTFAMGGTFLRGNQNPSTVVDGPGVLLYSGVSATTATIAERPKTAGYANGRAEYPGFNVRLGPDNALDSGRTGRSTLAGQNYGPYALKNRCKYYVRLGGVTGIHDKVAGPAENILLYGYQFTLTNFGLSFLDNFNRDSRVMGRVVVPQPSDIFVAFEELKFFCNGGLDRGKIAASTPPQTLAYWNAPIDILAMQFLQPDSCAVSEGYLTLGLHSFSSHVKDTLVGIVGFLSNGNLINKHFSDSKGGGLLGLDSRFKLPKQVKFRGPRRQTTQGGFEEYVFTPQVDAYLNVTGAPPNWNHSPPGGVPAGFWSLGGRLKVSFFEAVKIHLQTSPNRPPADPNLPGNWGNSVIFVANGTWDTGPADTSYFDGAYHDTWNRGFPYPSAPPGNGSGETRAQYTSLPKFLPIARQGWLGGSIEFKYKLQWTATTRTFNSLDSSESADDPVAAANSKKMVIISIDHRLPYLSAERAEMTFGATYSGMPKVNLANFVVNQLDEQTGVFKAAVDAGCGVVFDNVEKGLDRLAKLLNDQLRDYFVQMLDPVVQPMTTALYANLKNNLWASGNWNNITITNALAPYFGPGGELRTRLQFVLQGIDGAVSQLQQITDFIDETDNALAVINNQFLATNPDGSIPLARNLARELIKVIGQEIGGTLGSLVGGSGIDAKLGEILDPLLAEAQPTLADLKSALQSLRDVLTTVRNAVSGAGDFANELKQIVNQQLAEIDGLVAAVNTEVRTYLLKYLPNTPGKNFLALTEQQVRTIILQAIYDRFFATQLVAKTQVAIKQRLQDVEVAIRQGIDSVFAEVNKIIKKTVSDLLAEVDNSINGVLGEFGKYLGTGSIQGYATFNGDALRKLRMDGRFEFKIPDETTLEAFLEINQYTSKDKPPGCYQPAGDETLTEVIAGATNVPFNFISPGLRVNFDVKFSFVTDGEGTWNIQPVGMGGSFAMASGEVSFEAFKITKLAVGVAFGREDNYVSAALGLKMGSYGAWGGVFFGRTCTIAPIQLWDPFAAKAIGEPDPSFTGIYVYGEVHIPVSEVLLGIPATCLFQITADAGVGFFVFAEGPSYGARMGLGVNGEVICILGISGRFDLVGGKVNGKTRVAGRGEFCATVLGVDICKDVEMMSEVQSNGALKGKGDAK